MNNKTGFRCVVLIAAIILLFTEIMIGRFAEDFIRNYIGDVLVVPLIWCIMRTITPFRPFPGWKLPAAVLAFAFIVEFLQLFRIADLLDIHDPLLRTVIGTSFSVPDLLCYALGAVPFFIIENYIKNKNRES